MNIRIQNMLTAAVFVVFSMGLLGGVSTYAASQIGLKLHDAAEAGKVGRVSELLAMDAGRSQINRRWGFCKTTPLLQAVKKKHEAVVRLLLAHGADLDARGFNEKTPLHFAASNGCEAIARLLLNYGADIEATEEYSGTPLSNAAINRHRRLAQLLIKWGADTGILRPLDQNLEQLNEERLQAVRVWSEQLQQNCGLPKVVVNQIILPMALTDNQHRRFENLARTPDRTGNPRPRKRARGL